MNVQKSKGADRPFQKFRRHAEDENNHGGKQRPPGHPADRERAENPFVQTAPLAQNMARWRPAPATGEHAFR